MTNAVQTIAALVPTGGSASPDGWGAQIAQLLSPVAQVFVAREQAKTEQQYIKSGVTPPATTISRPTVPAPVPASQLNTETAGSPPPVQGGFFSRYAGPIALGALGLATVSFLGRSAR